jgi:hypothetical protein
MNRWIGGLLQLIGASLFVAAGAEGEVVLLVPAAASALAGLALWGKATPPQLPPPESRTLDERLARMEDVITGVQTDVAALRESRDFMDELYSGKSQGRRQIPGGPA